MKIDNPDTNEYEKYFKAQYDWSPEEIVHVLDSSKARQHSVNKWAWAIPNNEAIAAIKECGPIVEMGAGKGYWGSLLIKAGVDYIGFDKVVKDTYTPIHQGTPEVLAKHTTRALFLCWPPYATSMAYECLRYNWNTIIYVGEGSSGCTGDDDFHTKLDDEYEVVSSVYIPRWTFLNDSLAIYKRAG